MPIYYGNTKISPSGFSKVFIGNKKYYEKGEEPVGPDYFYVERIDSSGAGGFIEFRADESLDTIPTFEYSKNSKDNWQNYIVGTQIEIVKGDKIYFRGDNYTISDAVGNCSLFITDAKGVDINDMNSVQVSVGGEIVSLISKALTEPSVLTNYCFKYVLGNLSTVRKPIVSCSSLKLTNITSSNAYEGLLCGTYINDLPTVPSSSLSISSFRNAFNGCTRLSGNATINASYLNNFALRGAFTGTQITDVYLLNAQTVETGSAYTDGNISNHFGTALTAINGNLISTSSTSDAISVYFHFTDSDTYSFNVSNAVDKGDRKATRVNNFYTDNTQLKNDLLAQAGQYTVVNVFHLDGSNW